MKNKCETCGYRFKDDSEEICPECLTARDTDIDCENMHTHEDNISYVKNSGQQYNYGYSQPTTVPKKSGKGCVVGLIIFVAVILLVIAVPIIVMILGDSEGTGSDDNTIVQDISYGETITENDLELTFHDPHIITEFPEKFPERNNYKTIAIDVTIKNSAPYSGESYSYQSFNSYKARLYEVYTPFDKDDNDYDHSWTPMSFSGLLENQFPGTIYVYPDTEFEYTIYYEIPIETGDFYLQYETSDYFGGETHYTTFRFPAR